MSLTNMEYRPAFLDNTGDRAQTLAGSSEDNFVISTAS